MKKLAYLLLPLTFYIFPASAQVNYSVKGTLPANCEGQMIKMGHYENRALVVVDSAIVKDGKFEMQGNVAKKYFGNIYSDNKDLKLFANLVIGDEGTVTASVVDDKLIAEGGKETPHIAEYFKAIKAAQLIPDGQRGVLVQEYRDSATTKERKDEIYKTMTDNMNSVNKAQKKFVMDNCNSVVGGHFFGMCYTEFNEKEFNELLAKATPEFTDDPQTAKVIARVKASQSRMPGHKFTDFEMADADGKMHKASEYIKPGHFLLVDFWASWCGPCRAEMPNVKANYEKYHAKGFDVLGISFDSKKDAWLKAIDQLQLPWNHLSDLKGWESLCAELFGISGIPCMILVDGNTNTIIANDLRGEELGQKLAELFK